MFNEFGHSIKIYCDLTKNMVTYKLNQEDLHKFNEELNNKKRILPNQKKLDKEYKGYVGYWRVHKKSKMNNYHSSKTKSKEGMIKLSKEQFMQLYNRDRKLNNSGKIGGEKVAL